MSREFCGPAVAGVAFFLADEEEGVWVSEEVLEVVVVDVFKHCCLRVLGCLLRCT